MNIFVYSDESGVFDQVHNDVYVFGGIIFLSKESKDECTRKYIHVEKIVRQNGEYLCGQELKANKIKNDEKSSLFRSLNSYYKFGAIVDQRKVVKRIFTDKKNKQRYLDYVYKIALKRALQALIKKNIVPVEDVKKIYIFADEHTTATNGRYELREGLEQEFKRGTINYQSNVYYDPIFPKMDEVSLQFCNSQSKILIRAADIVANHIYHRALTSKFERYQIPKHEKMFITLFP